MRATAYTLYQQHIGQSQWVIGLLLACGAALGFSVKAIFVKLAYQYHVDAITLLMLRMLFSLPFFIVIAVLEERRAVSRLSRQQFGGLILLGVLGYYASSLLDFLGLQYITAGLERLILFVYPTLVVLISALVLGEKIARTAIFALLLSYAGVALAMMHDIQFSQGDILLGAGLVFASTLTYAVFLVGSGRLIPSVGARRFTAYAMIFSCLAVTIQFALVRDVHDLLQPLPVYGHAAAMAIFSTVIPAFMLTAAIQMIGASRTSIVGSLGPIATIVLAAMVLEEPISMMQMVGATLVIGGVIMLGKR